MIILDAFQQAWLNRYKKISLRGIAEIVQGMNHAAEAVKTYQQRIAFGQGEGVPDLFRLQQIGELLIPLDEEIILSACDPKRLQLPVCRFRIF